MEKPYERASCAVLQECIDLQVKKSKDYQNPNSAVKQADYYPRGLESIYDMLNTKMLRIRSLMDAIDSGHTAGFEGIEDSAKDLINYASFFVAYSRHGIDGQELDRDLFNRKVEQKTWPTYQDATGKWFYIKDGAVVYTYEEEIE